MKQPLALVHCLSVTHHTWQPRHTQWARHITIITRHFSAALCPVSSVQCGDEDRKCSVRTVGWGDPQWAAGGQRGVANCDHGPRGQLLCSWPIFRQGIHLGTWQTVIFERNNALCVMQNIYCCEAQGKGRAKGRPRKVTQRSFIDCRWWMVDILSLMLYTKFGWNHIADCSTVLLNGAVLQWSSRLYAWSTAPPQVSLSPGLS